MTVVEVAGPRVRIQPPLRFKHFGEVTMGVDQRAEVGVGQRQRRIPAAPMTAPPRQQQAWLLWPTALPSPRALAGGAADT